MKVVADTNVALSGLLWSGPPNRILKWARDGVLEIIGCPETTDELKRVLRYDKFHFRIGMLDTTPDQIHAYFVNLITFVPTPGTIPAVITQDPFDNLFLALALEHRAHLIIPGDRHLLDLEEHGAVQIVTPGEAAAIITELNRA